MPFELIVVLIALGVLVLAGVVVVVVRRSRAALPAARTPRELASPTPGRLHSGSASPPAPVREGAVPLPQDKPRGDRPAPLSAVDEARQAERRRYELGLARTRGGFVAKRGTLVKGIRLGEDPTHVEGKVNGTAVYLKTSFVKRA